MKIVMAAAENGAIPGGKVGGIGDVIRDLPGALAEAGYQVDVVTPGYGTFSKQNGAKYVGDLCVTFRGQQEPISMFSVPGNSPREGVKLWALEHPLFAASGEGNVYYDDPDHSPFSTDASRFALFSVGVAQALVDGTFADEEFPSVDVLHLHDWHAALISVLRAFHPAYEALKSIHTVYTIHNLALQGVRPLSDNHSSLQAWFPGLQYDHHKIRDPRAFHCINPMRAAINLADQIHTVSPTYACEIQRASNLEQGFFGGEGLEDDLRRASIENRLHGILNGCEYPGQDVPHLSIPELLVECEDILLRWVGEKPEVESAHLIASRRIAQLINKMLTVTETRAQYAPLVVTSVGRVTSQKVLLLQQVMEDNATALDHLLLALGERGIFIMLGSGDVELEAFFTKTASQHSNFVFLKGYSEELAQILYQNGGLFLMPSSFEPCGISQMLAMRAGQPCLVHSVGGLKDTVQDRKNGFGFTGRSLQEQAGNLLQAFDLVLRTKQERPNDWNNLASAASAARFTWSGAAHEMSELLYEH